MKDKIATILIADQNLENEDKLRIKLLNEGFRVFTVDSGRDAILYSRKRNIDIAIIDVNLNDIEGYKIIPLIKDINKNIKIIMTTSENSVSLERKCRATGIIYYAIKPLDTGLITDIVKRVIFKNKTINYYVK